jgi:hypothetical protein
LVQQTGGRCITSHHYEALSPSSVIFSRVCIFFLRASFVQSAESPRPARLPDNPPRPGGMRGSRRGVECGAGRTCGQQTAWGLVGFSPPRIITCLYSVLILLFQLTLRLRGTERDASRYRTAVGTSAACAQPSETCASRPTACGQSPSLFMMAGLHGRARRQAQNENVLS